jgi:hypothetical protein
MSVETTTQPVATEMPAEIAKAIVEVKKRVRVLGKDDENKFGHFKYVSVDKFYETVGKYMADAGLFLMVDEADNAIEVRQSSEGKPCAWLTVSYALTLYHESGASFGPISRTITVQATGPQAFGSAESYVQKYFLRGLFKIPTGEADADADPQNGMPAKESPKVSALRKKFLAVLERAADQGTSALMAAWNSLSPEAKEAIKADKDALKAVAAKADRKEPVHAAH